MLQQHLDDFSRHAAATRGSQSALAAALDTLQVGGQGRCIPGSLCPISHLYAPMQGELAAAEEAVLRHEARDVLEDSRRLVELRDRVCKLNAKVATVEVCSG